jgi:hypothetical protein
MRTKVSWAEQQVPRKRQKRELLPLYREKKGWMNPGIPIKSVKKVQPRFNDELWDHEWYLVRIININPT